MKRILLYAWTPMAFLWACSDEDDNRRAGNDLILTNIEEVMTTEYFWADEARAKNVDLSLYDPAAHERLEDFVEAFQSGSDRFTFLLTREEARVFEGEPVDIGLLLRYLRDTLFVAYVEPNSPAAAANIRRGMWVKSITRAEDGMKTYTPPEVSLEGIGPSSEGSRAFPLKDLESAIVFGTQGSSTLETISLSPAIYRTKGLSVSKVFTVGSKKVGYFYYSSFLAPDSEQEITDAFADFKSQGVEDVVVDFRYNSGGFIRHAEHMTASLFSPGAGRSMYSYQYNDETEDIAFTFPLTTVQLQAKRCFFLVDQRTASASELVINILRPFSQVELYLIGKTTIGKNMGSFGYYLPHPRPLSTKRPQDNPRYTQALFPIVFRLVNSTGDSDYDAGFVPDHTTFDDVRVPLGDERESMLAAALYYIENNAWPSLAARRDLEEQPILSAREVDALDIPLLIDDRGERPAPSRGQRP